MTNLSNFEDVDIDDIVWSPLYGYGRVYEIKHTKGIFKVTFNLYQEHTAPYIHKEYDYSGNELGWTDRAYPALFWQKVEMKYIPTIDFIDLHNFTLAKIDDRVWSLHYGWGTVKSWDTKADIMLQVLFDSNESEWYYLDGQSICKYDSPFPELYWIPMEIFPSANKLNPKKVEKKVNEILI